MAGFDSVDDWFAKGFRISQSSKAAKGYSGPRDKKRTTEGGAPSSRGGGGGGGGSGGARTHRANVKSVLAKAPEVMVKITGSSNGLKSAKNHIDYISRNGDIEIEDENGDKYTGNRAVREYKELLRVQQIPAESKKREFLHVIFSMPKDTPEAEMRKAVSKFCKDEFSNRRYVMAFHDDKDHKHVHVCVGTRDIDRADEPRLSPRKQDLRGWRESFAAALRDEGVDAAASPRSVRFKVQKQENFKVRQIKDNPRPNYSSRVDEGNKRALKESIAAGVRPENPFEEKISLRRNQVILKWEEKLKASYASGDFAEAIRIKALLDDGNKRPASRMQEAFDKEQQKDRFKPNQDDGKGRENEKE